MICVFAVIRMQADTTQDSIKSFVLTWKQKHDQKIGMLNTLNRDK